MKLCKYQLLSIMLHSVRATIVLLPFKYHYNLDSSQPKESYVYHKTDFNSMRRQVVLSDWTEKIMIQNQSKSVDELWNSFKSEIHEIRNKFVPKQLSGIPSWKTKGSMPTNYVFRDAIRNKSYTGDGYIQKMF